MAASPKMHDSVDSQVKMRNVEKACVLILILILAGNVQYSFIDTHTSLRSNKVEPVKLKNRLFREPGVRSRSDNFSHADMTQWGVFGARAAPKSMCTHQAHRLKKIDENRGFFDPNFKSVPNVRKSFLGRADRKKLSIYPFRLRISIFCMHDL